MANGAAGHRGLTAPALVQRVDRVELERVLIRPRESLSKTAGVQENLYRKRHARNGSVQVRIPESFLRTVRAGILRYHSCTFMSRMNARVLNDNNSKV